MSHRLNQRAPLEIEVTLESEHNFYCGITNDISEGGVFVATYQPPEVGEIVELELQLPSAGRSFRVLGEVRWLREPRASCDGCPPGCGLRFVDLGADAQAAIADFVRERDTVLYEAA